MDRSVAPLDCLGSSTEQCVAVQQILCRHPGVRQAAVVQHGGGLVALVVPDEAYLDDTLGRSNANAVALAKWQKTYDLNQSTKAAASAPPGFNTLGWDSSYTRRPLPPEDMREWVDVTVADILRLQSRTIYEIGCGTGMLLIRIAPHCDRYIAVDFSRAVLCRVREQLRSMPSVAERVELMERTADNFDGLAPASFDAVVINSAAQYFPNLTYLTRVLENAARCVRPGGHIFVGDVRSLPLLPAFAASVELFQAADDVDLAELRNRISRRLRHTPELVLSPAYFLTLTHRFPGISRVEIQLRSGRSDNEMTRYRCNAVLHVGRGEEPSCEVPFRRWSEDGCTLPEIPSRLQRQNQTFGISHIPNARIEKDILALEILGTADPAWTAASLRREVKQAATCGIHPQDLLDLGAPNSGFQVRLSWAASRRDGTFDALFVPGSTLERCPSAAFRWPEPEPSSFVHLANAPGQTRLRAELTERIIAHCRENLPQSFVPDRVVLVDSIPQTADALAVCEQFQGFEAK